MQKYFSLKEARILLPNVRDITVRYHQKIHAMQESWKNRLQSKEGDRKKIEGQIDIFLKEWALQLFRLGVEVKGLWLVDFDSGDGYYYCWKYNEQDIEYFHLYETGFSGRRPIELLEDRD